MELQPFHLVGAHMISFVYQHSLACSTWERHFSQSLLCWGTESPKIQICSWEQGTQQNPLYLYFFYFNYSKERSLKWSRSRNINAYLRKKDHARRQLMGVKDRNMLLPTTRSYQNEQGRQEERNLVSCNE